MSKIALYGGNFDPPHLGHVLVLTNVLNAGIVDEIVFIPTGDDRYDKKLFASGEHRVKMLELLIDECFVNCPISIDTVQLDGLLPEGSKTIDLVNNFKERREPEELFFIVGSDNVPHLPKWVNFETLLNELTFISVPRSGFHIESYPDYVSELSGDVVPVNNFASSEIRQMIQSDKQLSGILPTAVIDYVKTNQLYL